MGKSKFSLKTKDGKFSISEAVATEQLMTWLEYYDIDIESIEDKKTKSMTETVFNKIVRFIRLGIIDVKIDNGVIITQNCKNKEKLIYKGIRAENKVQMDGHDEKDDHKKMYALLGSLSEVGTSAIYDLPDQDMSAAECIGFVFLQV